MDGSALFAWLAVLVEQLKAEIQINDHVVRAGLLMRLVKLKMLMSALKLK